MNEEEAAQQFRTTVMRSYYAHPREEMPWREKISPYRVLVSEFMLQQTQVSRVLAYFEKFLRKWKNLSSLAAAPLSAVITLWQGLGYNRRARYLHLCARELVGNHGARIPYERELLLRLPGIGIYTASAIRVFAYNIAEVVLETNIRRAIMHWFFPQQEGVGDELVRKRVEQTMDRQNPRQWYWALMDYGYWLKFQVSNPNRRSMAYRHQASFAGSNRQLRGAIIRVLSRNKQLRVQALLQKLRQDLGVVADSSEDRWSMVERAKQNLETLRGEGMLMCERGYWYLAN